jgi:hypothetical protein
MIDRRTSKATARGALALTAGGLWIVRLLAIGVSLYLLLHLARQFAGGSISMGIGEFDDRIVVTSVFGRLLALLMWGTFLSGLLLAGIRPSVFITYRWLLPVFLVGVFVFYMLFSLLADYRAA